MAYDTHPNLAYSAVATAPSPASSGTTLTVATGDGAKFGSGAVAFNVTIWPINVQPTRASAEIARVSNVSGDVLTLTRATATETTVIGPRSVIVGDQIAVTVTGKSLTDLEALATGTSGGVPYYNTSSSIASSAVLAATALVLGGGAATAPATDGNWTINAQHILNSATQPRASAYNSAAQSINNNARTVLTFDSDSADITNVGSMHSTSTNTSRLTVPFTLR